MSENSNDLQNEESQDEITVLKERADLLGIKYHPNIGLEKLREKVNSTLSDKSDEEDSEEVIEVDKKSTKIRKETEQEMRKRLNGQMRKLVRVIVSPNDPLKSELEGEVYTVSNRYVPTIKRFVPYNNENGWHIEQAIYDILKERKYQAFKTVTMPNGDKVRKGTMKRAFNIEVLPQLTKKELDNLARDQAARNSIDKEED